MMLMLLTNSVTVESKHTNSLDSLTFYTIKQTFTQALHTED